MGNLTAEEAHKKLNTISSQEEFKALINDLSVEVEGKNPTAQTLLYSGEIIKEDTRVNTSDVASQLSNNPNMRLIDNTEADRFLASIYVDQESHPDFKMGEDLREKLAKTFGGNPLKRGTPSNTYYNQANGGAWDKVSENFVLNSKGEVVTLIGDNASVDRIFFQTELQAIRENPNITHIDGIEKNELFKELDTLETPQHQINYFKTMTYARVEIYNALKESEGFELKSHLEVTRAHMQDFLGSNTPQAKEIANKIDTHQLDLFTKTEVSHTTGIAYDKISDEEIKTFLSQDTDQSKTVLDKIDNRVKELSTYNTHMQNFDVSTHGKYAILGAVGASILSTTQADASIPTLHLNAHLDKDIFDTLSTNEQIGAEIGAGFNGINAIQAGEEFRAGASKSAGTLFDPNAYKQGLAQATDAWRPSLTKEVATLGAMDSAKVAGKSFLKKLPLIGLGAGIAFGIGRAMDGDWKGAGMEVASGAMSLVPGWGTAGSVAMDAALLERDTGIITHATQKLSGKEEERERFVQPEDNYVTIESSQENTLEYADNGMVILGGDYTVSVDDIERAEEEPFDSASHAQRIVDEMSERYGWGNEYGNSNEMGMEIE